MRELLIKIRALFEGGASIDDANKKFSTMRSRMTECMQTGSAFGSAIGSLAATAAQGLVGMATRAVEGIGDMVKGFGEGVIGAAEYAHQMHNLSVQTGQSVQDTIVLTQAFKNAGLGSEMVGQSMNMLQKALTGVNEEGLPTKGIFDKLGLSISDLKNDSPIQALHQISVAISSLGTASDRTRAVFEMFGRAGGRLLPLLGNSGAIENAKTQVGGLAESLGTSEEELSKFAEAWSSLDTKKMQLFAGFAKELAGNLGEAGDKLNRMDLSKVGEQLAMIFKWKETNEQKEQDKKQQQISSSNETPFSRAMQNFFYDAYSFKVVSDAWRLHTTNQRTADTDEANDRLAAELEDKKKNRGSLPARGPHDDIFEAPEADSHELDPLREHDKRVADFASEQSKIEDEGRIKALPLADQLKARQAEFAAQSARATSLDSTPDEAAAADKAAVAAKKEILEIQRKINEEAEKKSKKDADEKEKADDQARTNAEKREELDLELRIKEAQETGNDALEKRLRWQQDYNRHLKEGVAIGDPDAWNKAKRFADADMDTARSAGDRAAGAVQLSSLGKSGSAIGEQVMAAYLSLKSKEANGGSKEEKDKELHSRFLEVAVNVKKIADKRGGYL